MKTLEEIRPGQTMGRFEFLVPIAHGGMAAVWVARLKGTRGFSKIVAIKTMLPTLSDDPLFEEMFLDEAQLAAQIHHPNVAEILDLGEEDDVLYQVMEYIDGETLATLLRSVAKKDKRIPMAIGLRILVDACHGLHAAHELKNVEGRHLGLVHRDISPQNIMVTFDGVVKLVDFGVAKASGRTSSDTTSGKLKGKAPYMSPEQASGGAVDRRTDIFAMGIVAYQVATGKHPFRGENDIATLHNILHRAAPSPRFVDPKFPRPVESVLLKAIDRNPEKRFSSAAEMATALHRAIPPNARTEGIAEVGAFIQELVGSTGEKRREAVREAIRRADARISLTGVRISQIPEGELSGPVVPLAEIGTDLSGPVSRGNVLGAKTDRISLSEIGETLPEEYADSEVGDSPTPSKAEELGSTSAAASLSHDALKPVHYARRRTGLWVVSGVLALGIAILGVLGFQRFRSRVTALPPSTEPSAAVTPEATDHTEPVVEVEAGEDDGSAMISDIESAFPPVPDSAATRPRPGRPWPKRPKPPPTASTPPTATKPPPTSTWKPPPVSDPGF